MTKKLPVLMLLVSMTVSAVIIIVTVSGSVNRRKIQAEQMAKQTTVQTTPVEVGYYLREFEGDLAVFRGTSPTPFKKLGVNTDLMSDYDKVLLENGIFVRTQSELNQLIEDYTS